MSNSKTSTRKRKGFLYWLGCIYFGGEQRFLIYRALNDIAFVFDEREFDEQKDAATHFYSEQMRKAGFDPHDPEVFDKIESEVWSNWGRQSGYFAQQEQLRLAQRQYERDLALYRQQCAGPARGSAAHMRTDALETYQRTGVWGLNSYGGHILTEQERQNLGL